jgi:GH25 family lysozyme M1 (1,4-beta-N-acetylmuramidase)
MIRCGFRNLTIDSIQEDSKFKYNISEANRLDIPVGVYYYSTAISEIEVLEEASYVLNLVKDYKITYPIVYDFETFGQNRAEGLSDAKINKNALRFLDYIRGHGYYAMLYGNQRSLENNWDLSYFEGYDIWLAQYNDVPTYQGDFVMWQYTDRGRIDGINGNVDMDISYYAYEERT